MNNEITPLDNQNNNLTKLVNKSSSWMGGVGYYHIVVGALLVLFSLLSLASLILVGIFIKNRSANEFNLFTIFALLYFLFILGTSVVNIFMGLKLVKAANCLKEYIQTNLTAKFEEALKSLYLFFATFGTTAIISVVFMILCIFGPFSMVGKTIENATREELKSSVEKVGVETDNLFKEQEKYRSK